MASADLPSASVESEKEEEEGDDFQILLLGNTQVGKTCLVTRYTDATYMDTKPTTGIECFKSSLEVGEKVYSFKIWDTAGENRFRTFATAFVDSAQGFAICYDCTNRASFNSVLDDWSTSLVNARPLHDFALVLVACKIDLRASMVNASACVSEEEGRQKAALLSRKHLMTVQYYEVSARRNELCTEVFTTLATACVTDTAEEALVSNCKCAIL